MTSLILLCGIALDMRIIGFQYSGAPEAHTAVLPHNVTNQKLVITSKARDLLSHDSEGQQIPRLRLLITIFSLVTQFYADLTSASGVPVGLEASLCVERK